MRRGRSPCCAGDAVVIAGDSFAIDDAGARRRASASTNER
jgi:hypothetical protein